MGICHRLLDRRIDVVPDPFDIGCCERLSFQQASLKLLARVLGAPARQFMRIDIGLIVRLVVSAQAIRIGFQQEGLAGCADVCRRFDP